MEAAHRVRSPRPTGTITIDDVARHAGVSTATVSRVQSGAPTVAQPTRERVLRAIEELRYTPSPVARSLAGGRHGATGIVFPDMSGPYYAEVILGYEQGAALAGQSVFILATHGRAEADQLVLDLAGRVDGLVILGRTVDDRLVERISDGGLPVVLLARAPVAGADAVRADNRGPARILAEHLLAHGHRQLVFLGDPDASPDAADRCAGVMDAIDAAGAPPLDPVPCRYRERDGHDAALRLLRDRPDITALVCANDEIALGATVAATSVGRSVGDDLAITGWDDIAAARHVVPPLTTVRQPMRRLGETAARLLADRIAGGRREPRQELLDAELVIRASCGCVPIDASSTTNEEPAP